MCLADQEGGACRKSIWQHHIEPVVSRALLELIHTDLSVSGQTPQERLLERDVPRTKAKIETARNNLLFSQSGNDAEMRSILETKMEYLDGLQKRKEEKKTNRTKAALLQQKLVERDAYCSDMTDEENVMLWRASV